MIEIAEIPVNKEQVALSKHNFCFIPNDNDLRRFEEKNSQIYTSIFRNLAEACFKDKLSTLGQGDNAVQAYLSPDVMTVSDQNDWTVFMLTLERPGSVKRRIISLSSRAPVTYGSESYLRIRQFGEELPQFDIDLTELGFIKENQYGGVDIADFSHNFDAYDKKDKQAAAVVFGNLQYLYVEKLIAQTGSKINLAEIRLDDQSEVDIAIKAFKKACTDPKYSAAMEGAHFPVANNQTVLAVDETLRKNGLALPGPLTELYKALRRPFVKKESFKVCTSQTHVGWELVYGG